MNKTDHYIQQEKVFGAHDYNPIPVVLEKGQGVFVWDVEGKRYFDMLSGYSALNQGHCHPKIAAGAKKQMDTLTLTARAFHNNRLGDYFEKVCQLTGKDKMLPMNTGAEGVETAIKAMRKWSYEVKGVPDNKAEIIVAENNFHGRTSTIVSFSSNRLSYQGFGPKMPGFVQVPFNEISALEQAINENTAGFLIEPIQGEAGVLIPDENYLNMVREICNRENILLACDEIQTGLGRTGKLFCFQHNDIDADIIIMGKALSGGFYPISGIAADDEIMDVFVPGNHGSTYGGNPLAATIGMAALDVIIDEDLPENSRRMGEYFMDQLQYLNNNPNVKEIRGKGLLVAIEMNSPVARQKCMELRDEGILVKDTHETTIRFAPPLIITKDQIDEAMQSIRKVLN